MATAQALDNDDSRWSVVLRRDRSWDGQFVTGVLTTGIYCRPSCAARHPKRENVRFFGNGEDARAIGLRPCLRCKPDEVARDAEAVKRALALIAEEGAPSLERLAAAVGYSPFHFQRLFKRSVGVSPAEYARGRRARQMVESLATGGRVTDAIYEAGYSGPSRFYDDARKRLGMTPSAWRNGGAGVTIRWAIVATTLGPMLLAATERGICRLSFDEDEAELRRRFPNAEIVAGGEGLSALMRDAVAAVDQPAQMPDLSLDVAGTAFQQAIWRELSLIPPGETLSYAALAARAGRPNAVRAAGSACGANQVAVLIPCHRAKRGDGTLGGYAYGLERKGELLRRELESNQPGSASGAVKDEPLVGRGGQ